MPRRGKNGKFVKGGVRHKAARRSTAVARRSSAGAVRRGRRAGAAVRSAGAAVKRSWHRARHRAGGFFSGFGQGAGIKGALKGALPHMLIAGLAFVACRWGTKLLLRARDSGWMGYVGNGVALIAGYWLLRKFAPRFATAYLIGAGASIAARAFAHFMPDQASSAGLLSEGSRSEALPPGGAAAGPGTQGIYKFDAMRGIYARAAGG